MIPMKYAWKAHRIMGGFMHILEKKLICKADAVILTTPHALGIYDEKV